MVTGLGNGATRRELGADGYDGSFTVNNSNKLTRPSLDTTRRELTAAREPGRTSKRGRSIVADHVVTPAELVEAEIRRVMARLPKANWETRQARREDLAWIDVALDQWLELTR